MSAKHTRMDAAGVRALVAQQFPQAMQSPLAQLFGNVAAQDEADRAIEFADMQASASIAHDQQMRADAGAHARGCIDACQAADVEFDADTLSANIESNFPELDVDECDEIALAAIARATGEQA